VFFYATSGEEILSQSRRGTDSAKELTKILKALLKNSKQLTEDQEEYMRRLIQRLEEGAIPKKMIQKVNQAIKKLGEEIQNPLKVIAILQREISPVFLKGHFVEKIIPTNEKGEVILSLYLSKEVKGDKGDIKGTFNYIVIII
jgi:Glu-tRNA(Gln) amidotransferase subunit E-like FAD-binding protein